jgi:hypothetical protein
MNPSVPESVINATCERDPASASAEWIAEFRSDIEGFVARETVLACVDRGVIERPPKAGIRYMIFTDPSGGTTDSMCAAVAHVEDDVVVIDAVREIRAPFDPESAVDELATLFKAYGVRETVGDRYSGQWCAQAFERRRIRYKPSDTRPPHS